MALISTRGTATGIHLHLAAFPGDFDTMRVLIAAGIDFHAKGAYGKTILHRAMPTRKGAIEYLLRQPAPVTQKHNRVGHLNPLRPLVTCPVAPGQLHMTRSHRARTVLTRTVPINTAITEACVLVARENIRVHQGSFPIALVKVSLVLLESHT